MRSNTRSDTRPEVLLRSELHRRGRRFRKDLPVETASRRIRPDVVFTRHRLAVFLDGCFWHCCPEHSRRPSVNTEYWEPKLARNVARDRDTDLALQAAGWRVLRAWEHERPELIADRVEAALVGGPVSEALVEGGPSAPPATAFSAPAASPPGLAGA